MFDVIMSDVITDGWCHNSVNWYNENETEDMGILKCTSSECQTELCAHYVCWIVCVALKDTLSVVDFSCVKL